MRNTEGVFRWIINLLREQNIFLKNKNGKKGGVVKCRGIIHGVQRKVHREGSWEQGVHGPCHGHTGHDIHGSACTLAEEGRSILRDPHKSGSPKSTN